MVNQLLFNEKKEVKKSLRTSLHSAVLINVTYCIQRASLVVQR